MKILKSILLAITLTATLAAAEGLEGQVFIATKGGATVRLGATTVMLVESIIAKSNCAAVLVKTQKKIESDIRADEIKERLTNLAKAMGRMTKENRAVAEQTFARLRAEYLSMQKDREYNTSIYSRLNAMDWKPEQTVATDADGNFTMKQPPADRRWMLVAFNSRNIGRDMVETYIWIVPVLPGQKQLLQNNNLLGN